MNGMLSLGRASGFWICEWKKGMNLCHANPLASHARNILANDAGRTFVILLDLSPPRQFSCESGTQHTFQDAQGQKSQEETTATRGGGRGGGGGRATNRGTFRDTITQLLRRQLVWLFRRKRRVVVGLGLCDGCGTESDSGRRDAD